jgi:hypothetical protein
MHQITTLAEPTGANQTPTSFARLSFAAACTVLALCAAIGIVAGSLH